MFEAVFRGGARAAYGELDERERAEVDALIRLLELDPYLDETTKFKTLVAPLMMNAFDNGAWRIMYLIRHPFVEIYGIRPATRR